jgi:hypothetical protein
MSGVALEGRQIGLGVDIQAVAAVVGDEGRR